MRKLILACLTSLTALFSAAPPALAATTPSPTPFMEWQFINNSALLARKPSGVVLAVDGRNLLRNLHWVAWTSDKFNSVAVATGDEEEYECAPKCGQLPNSRRGWCGPGQLCELPRQRPPRMADSHLPWVYLYGSPGVVAHTGHAHL